MHSALGSFSSPKHQLEARDVPLQWLKPLYRPRTKPSVSAQPPWDWPRDLCREDWLPISPLYTAVPSSPPTLSSQRDISSPLWSWSGKSCKEYKLGPVGELLHTALEDHTRKANPYSTLENEVKQPCTPLPRDVSSLVPSGSKWLPRSTRSWEMNGLGCPLLKSLISRAQRAQCSQ